MAGRLFFRLVDEGDGLAVFEGDPNAALLNPAGMVHGTSTLLVLGGRQSRACNAASSARKRSAATAGVQGRHASPP